MTVFDFLKQFNSYDIVSKSQFVVVNNFYNESIGKFNISKQEDFKNILEKYAFNEIKNISVVFKKHKYEIHIQIII